MKRLLPAIFAFVAWATAASFTLDQVLSAPFPSDMVSAPGGGKVAWLLNERGARNIWIAAAPDFKGVRLTSYTVDDGQDIGQLQWTPDARAVVFVRGGDLEFLGRPDPNPSANTEGVEQAIHIVAPGEEVRRIALGHSPAISPKGDVMAFLRGGQIFSVPLSGSGGGAPLFRAGQGVTAGELRWSPDGSKLAYVSNRGTHAIIAVYDVTTKSLSYIDPSVDRDANIVWSSDGKQIAFTRTLTVRGGGRGDRRSGEPWTIRVASVADGASRQIWRADEGSGSLFHPIESPSQLYWSADGRIVFPWEKDGWSHLYSVSAEGGKATLLTPGEFEVEHVSFSEDRREIVFSSNQGDIDRRHIWRVSAAGGPPRAVTSGEGLEWSPVPVNGGVAYLHADAQRPARAAVQIGATARDLAPDSIPADFPADSLVVPQQVIYSASDGNCEQLILPDEIHGFLRHISWLRAYRATADFFKRKL